MAVAQRRRNAEDLIICFVVACFAVFGSLTVIGAFIFLTAILFAILAYTKLSETMTKQRDWQRQWNIEIARISGLVLDLELICKKVRVARN